MTESDIRSIAENHVAKSNLKGYKAVFSEMRKDEQLTNEWTVIFKLYTPDNFLFDTPLIITVDEKTGHTEFFPTL